MREIVLDTETTGFEPQEGHRIVEIGAIELFNHLPTGRSYHQYINPMRPMPKDAFEVHGLGDEFLRDKPAFAAIALDFLRFIADAPLVIHNASFDMKFLNAELDWAGMPKLAAERAVDTLLIARQRFPGSPASLDALCRRFGVTIPVANGTAHFWTVNCWPRSIWNWSAAANPIWRLPPCQTKPLVANPARRPADWPSGGLGRAPSHWPRRCPTPSQRPPPQSS